MSNVCTCQICGIHFIGEYTDDLCCKCMKAYVLWLSPREDSEELLGQFMKEQKDI